MLHALLYTNLLRFSQICCREFLREWIFEFSLIFCLGLSVQFIHSIFLFFSFFFCCAGYKTIALFQGIADAYIHTTLIKKWDICAGNAILRDFGGTQTTLRGAEINYDGHGSPDHNPKNEGGLLATLWEPQMYREKLAPILDAEKH